MLGGRKFQVFLSVAILFYVVSSPFAYRFVESVLGGLLEAVVPSLRRVFKVAEQGCPTHWGILLHSLVYAFLVTSVL